MDGWLYRIVICNYLYIENILFFFQTRILHNLMPIFTFMGTNLLRHDDSYTFQVINKTLDTVIPTLLQVLSVFVSSHSSYFPFS